MSSTRRSKRTASKEAVAEPMAKRASSRVRKTTNKEPKPTPPTTTTTKPKAPKKAAHSKPKVIESTTEIIKETTPAPLAITSSMVASSPAFPSTPIANRRKPQEPPFNQNQKQAFSYNLNLDIVPIINGNKRPIVVHQIDINAESFDVFGNWRSIKEHTRMEAINEYAA